MTTENTEKITIKTGTIPDGRTAILRSRSADGTPRLEIHDIAHHSATITKYTGEKGSVKPFPSLSPDCHDQWTSWSPLDDIRGKYDLDNISYQNDDLKITLKSLSDDNNHSVLVQFCHGIIAYRMTIELLRCCLIGELEIIYGTAFYNKSTFFKIINSSYIDMISLKTDISAVKNTLHHFALICADSVIDIVANYEPKVQHIGTKSHA